MLNKIVKVSFLVIFVGLLTACAGSQFYHENFMNGQVVDVKSNQVIVCVGNSDGAEIGQLLDVYRVEYEVGTQEGDDGFRRVYMGELKVDAIVDKHFAKATISKGNVKKHDMVEFKK